MYELVLAFWLNLATNSRRSTRILARHTQGTSTIKIEEQKRLESCHGPCSCAITNARTRARGWSESVHVASGVEDKWNEDAVAGSG